ncbi:MAG: DUF2920 family protein, partial [Candidatus Methylumidiphilus sp.]
GLLSALDHLQVLGALLQRFPIDRSRLYVFGSSMGGYIGSMIGKFAPHTFRLLVDNSGFVRAPDLGRATLGFRRGWVHGLAVTVRDTTPWQPDPTLPHAFNLHHALIRDVRVVDHMRPTTTVRRLYHSVGDQMVPLAEKRTYAERAARFGPVSLECIDQARIDGVMFKTLEHGMGASLMHVADDAWRAFNETGLVETGAAETGADSDDFCRESRYAFACGRYAYHLEYSKAGEVALSLHSVSLP